jgi:hypothetical protein
MAGWKRRRLDKVLDADIIGGETTEGVVKGAQGVERVEIAEFFGGVGVGIGGKGCRMGCWGEER